MKYIEYLTGLDTLVSNCMLKQIVCVLFLCFIPFIDDITRIDIIFVFLKFCKCKESLLCEYVIYSIGITR